MVKGLFVLDLASYDAIYSLQEREQINGMVEIYVTPQTAETIHQDPQVLEQAEAIFSGWGCPVLTEGLLHHAPNLKVVFYGLDRSSVSLPMLFGSGIYRLPALTRPMRYPWWSTAWVTSFSG